MSSFDRVKGFYSNQKAIYSWVVNSLIDPLHDLELISSREAPNQSNNSSTGNHNEELHQPEIALLSFGQLDFDIQYKI